MGPKHGSGGFRSLPGEGHALNEPEPATIHHPMPGDILVFSNVPYEAHEKLLDHLADILPDGVNAMVFESSPDLTVIRPEAADEPADYIDGEGVEIRFP